VTHDNFSEDIKNINNEESAIIVAIKITCQAKWSPELKPSHAAYMTGKSRKALSRKIEGWLVYFDLPVPEGTSPDCMWVELYPQLGEFYIPQIM
jgi:hypothetical protein